MQKNYLHNMRPINENSDKKKLLQFSNTDTKRVVDINILLNRVKIEKKNQTKRKIIFFSFVTMALALFGALILSVK